MIISDLAYLEDISEKTDLTVSGGLTYIIGDDFRIDSGDTLSQIGEDIYNDGSSSCYNAIADFNNIPDPDKIFAGDTISLPAGLC